MTSRATQTAYSNPLGSAQTDENKQQKSPKISEISLKAHTKLVHDGVIDFKCDVCEITFTNSNNLKIHHRKFHEKLL